MQKNKLDLLSVDALPLPLSSSDQHEDRNPRSVANARGLEIASCVVYAGFLLWHFKLIAIAAWAAGLVILVLTRPTLAVPTKIDPKPRERVFLLNLIAGLWWSTSICLLPTSPGPMVQVLVSLWLMGVAISAVSVHGATSQGLAYSIPIAVAATLPQLLHAAAPQRLLGIILLCMLAVVLAYQHAARQKLASVKTRARRYHNLLAHTKSEKDAMAARNAELAAELQNYRHAETQLRTERDEARFLSTRDSVTGIPNRRYFDNSIKNEIARAVRERQSIALILCDIDHFKKYNDYYGHIAGDDALRRVAELLQDHARRGGDVAMRFGGEEFAILLPNTRLEAAHNIAEEMRQQVSNAGIEHARSPYHRLTISLGVAALTPRAINQATELVTAADRALYNAKKSGRNITVLADHS